MPATSTQEKTPRITFLEVDANIVEVERKLQQKKTKVPSSVRRKEGMSKWTRLQSRMKEESEVIPRQDERKGLRMMVVEGLVGSLRNQNTASVSARNSTSS